MTKNNQEPMMANSKQWENICERCGRCCFEKYEYRGKIFYSDTPCEYLDLETKLCRIYPQRFELNPECVRLSPDLVQSGVLPDDCPYVKKIK
ncbi:hypothetical protein SAMN05660420_01374 [Desulfuromusa kysingii]|uniref:Uncharacterized protein n=1 Tax=Desulfuromusa kysingii TaxID=37625 RepID=A0A1H3YSP0_9BACT|nr:YkgJ family cysteine cluster protein [Desulfuromusa kysingii]SEA14553.1 hypothetical protein SAMN05660420_01374 [Desulfuromusa kysingii]